MADNFENGFGAQALDLETLNRAFEGDSIRTGCAPSKGANALEVDVAAGTAQIDGSDTDISAQTVTLTAGSGDPRKDVIYLDTNGTAQVVAGTPEPAQPSGETGRQTYQPQPVDLAGTAGVVIAEVWVPAGASDVTSDDISDRRPLVGMSTVPSNAIVMWSGAIGDIPTGWTLCDGTNGAPNLQNRFIVGAGDQYAVDAAGGADEVQLTEAELASHSHQADFDETDGGSGNVSLMNAAGDEGTASVDSAGGDEPHENRPPYYALAYIMKL